MLSNKFTETRNSLSFDFNREGKLAREGRESRYIDMLSEGRNPQGSRAGARFRHDLRYKDAS